MNALPVNAQAGWRRVSVHGPDRVLVNANGEAVSSVRARRIAGVTPDIIFIRDDGWSLGAPAALEAIAYSIWRKEWAAFARRGDLAPSPITEYQPRTERTEHAKSNDHR